MGYSYFPTARCVVACIYSLAQTFTADLPATSSASPASADGFSPTFCPIISFPLCSIQTHHVLIACGAACNDNTGRKGHLFVFASAMNKCGQVGQRQLRLRIECPMAKSKRNACGAEYQVIVSTPCLGRPFGPWMSGGFIIETGLWDFRMPYKRHAEESKMVCSGLSPRIADHGWSRLEQDACPREGSQSLAGQAC